MKSIRLGILFVAGSLAPAQSQDVALDEILEQFNSALVAATVGTITYASLNEGNFDLGFYRTDEVQESEEVFFTFCSKSKSGMRLKRSQLTPEPNSDCSSLPGSPVNPVRPTAEWVYNAGSESFLVTASGAAGGSVEVSCFDIPVTVLTAAATPYEPGVEVLFPAYSGWEQFLQLVDSGAIADTLPGFDLEASIEVVELGDINPTPELCQRAGSFVTIGSAESLSSAEVTVIGVGQIQ